jgi:hypothetical protein
MIFFSFSWVTQKLGVITWQTKDTFVKMIFLFSSWITQKLDEITWQTNKQGHILLQWILSLSQETLEV